MRKVAVFQIFLTFLLKISAQVVVEPIVSSTSTYQSFDSDIKMLAMPKVGGFVALFRSQRNGENFNNIYAQKIDALGNQVWSKSGIGICPEPYNQLSYDATSDAQGNIIVVWEDQRKGIKNSDIYIQKINQKGEILWSNTGIPVCSAIGKQTKPRIAINGAQEIFVIWEDQRKTFEKDIFMQKLNSSGQRLWAYNGKKVTDAPNTQKNFDICKNWKNGFIIAWEDFRNEKYWNIYAQSFNSKGEVHWEDNGKLISFKPTHNQNKVSISEDGMGGTIIAFETTKNQNKGIDIYHARLNQDGNLQYELPTCLAINNQTSPKIIKHGKLAIAYWKDRRNGKNAIYGQLIDISKGKYIWGNDGFPLCFSNENVLSGDVLTNEYFNYRFLVYKDSQNGQLKIQKTDGLTQKPLSVSDNFVCTYPSNQEFPTMMTDVKGDLWLAWVDSRTQNTKRVFFQKFDTDGKMIFPESGKSLLNISISQNPKIESPELFSTSDKNAYLVWYDFRNNDKEQDLYIQKFDDYGQTMWKHNGVAITNSKGKQSRVCVADGANESVFVAWIDERAGGVNEEIYIQKIDKNGKILFKKDGISICNTKGGKSQLRMIEDGAGGVYLAWTDSRDFVSQGFDVYIQHIDFKGNALYQNKGRKLLHSEFDQNSPFLLSDKKGGFYIFWIDNRYQRREIFLQHFDNLEKPLFYSGGKKVCLSQYNQSNPKAIWSKDGNIFLSWRDERYGASNTKIYAQKIQTSGENLWSPDGVIVAEFSGAQFDQEMLAYENGVYIAWKDLRDKYFSKTNLIVQNIDLNGKLLWKKTGEIAGQFLKNSSTFGMSLGKNSELFLAWNDYRNTVRTQSYYQVFAPNGKRKVQYNGKPISIEPNDQSSTSIIPSKAGGDHILIWLEQNKQTKKYRIFRALLANKVE